MRIAAFAVLLVALAGCDAPQDTRAEEAVARMNAKKGGVRVLNLSSAPLDARAGSTVIGQAVAPGAVSGFALMSVGEADAELTISGKVLKTGFKIGADLGTTLVLHPDGKTITLLEAEPRKGGGEFNVTLFRISPGQADAKDIGKVGLELGGKSLDGSTGRLLAEPGEWKVTGEGLKASRLQVDPEGSYSIIVVDSGQGSHQVISLWNGGGDKPAAAATA